MNETDGENRIILY